MQVVDLPGSRDPSGRKLHRRRYVDEVECSPDDALSAFRRAELLRTFTAQPELWRLPALGLAFQRMTMYQACGFWCIQIERSEEK